MLSVHESYKYQHVYTMKNLSIQYKKTVMYTTRALSIVIYLRIVTQNVMNKREILSPHMNHTNFNYLFNIIFPIYIK